MDFLTINGKSIADYKQSYTLIYMIENIMATFNKISDDEKKMLLNKLDFEISEKFEMSQANLLSNIFFSSSLILLKVAIIFSII